MSKRTRNQDNSKRGQPVQQQRAQAQQSAGQKRTTPAGEQQGSRERSSSEKNR